MKMEQTECSETSAYKIETPGNYPEESKQHSEHGEGLKSNSLQVTLRKTRFKNQESYTVITFSLCVCVDLRTSSNIFLIQHSRTGFYNRDGQCLQRGTD
jgi:hypothetical protein